jgi:hypothetical protein
MQGNLVRGLLLGVGGSVGMMLGMLVGESPVKITTEAQLEPPAISPTTPNMIEGQLVVSSVTQMPDRYLISLDPKEHIDFKGAPRMPFVSCTVRQSLDSEPLRVTERLWYSLARAKAPVVP